YTSNPKPCNQFRGHRGARFGQRRRSRPELLRERGHADVVIAAGMDEREIVERVADVERESMVADPAPHGDADRSELLALGEPHAGAPGHAPARETPARERRDQRVLQRAQPAMEIAAHTVEPDDRVADQLSRPMPCDVATAGHLDDLDARALERAGVHADVPLART